MSQPLEHLFARPLPRRRSGSRSSLHRAVQGLVIATVGHGRDVDSERTQVAETSAELLEATSERRRPLLDRHERAMSVLDGFGERAEPVVEASTCAHHTERRQRGVLLTPHRTNDSLEGGEDLAGRDAPSVEHAQAVSDVTLSLAQRRQQRLVGERGKKLRVEGLDAVHSDALEAEGVGEIADDLRARARRLCGRARKIRADAFP